MPMRNEDVRSREELRLAMQKALTENNTDGFYQALDEMMETIGVELREEHERQVQGIRDEFDQRVLVARGVRQLTTKENEYYQKLIDAMKAKDPKQAVANMDVALPKTVIDSVFEDLRTNHPLLSRINFVATGGAIQLLMNTNGYQEAVWGELCDEIVKELSAGFRAVDTMLLKLSAFLPVCKAMLDLGPAWIDNYVREVLYEALANGMEAGIVVGDGNKKPIGMNRQVGENVTVTGGVYPEKPLISVDDLSPAKLGRLLAMIAVDESGKARQVTDIIMIVNPQDYFSKIMPSTTIMAPDGTYRNNVLPYPMTVIQSPAVPLDRAIMGIANRYFAPIGTEREGRIEYSDHYNFLQDKRMYLIKAYANGMPKDNNAFLWLDISNLQPSLLRVETVTPADPSEDANLADLRIGNIALNTAFVPGTITYTAATTNVSNTITAIPADAGAKIVVQVGTKTIANGSAATWASGENTVKAIVTAADGTTTKTYTITVTKS